jgi:hypothetical protein
MTPGFSLPSASLCRKARRRPQDRQRHDADEKHSEFHNKTWNDKRTISCNRRESCARDFFGGDVDEFRGAVAFGAGTRRDFGELGVDRAGTKRSHCHAGAAQFGTNRF